MHFVFRTVSCATRRRSFLLKTSPVIPLASSLSHGKQLCIRLSSTGYKSAAENQMKTGAEIPPKGLFSSTSPLPKISPLPKPPPPPKGTPPTINTHDIEQYVQPLYARGWGLSPILPNGNGIAVLRKRFEFANAEAQKRFVTDLRKYETKNQHHAKVIVNQDKLAVLVSTWTHVARRGSDREVEGTNDENVQGVTARDIRLAYALEGLFVSALAAGGSEYVPVVRPEADRPKTVEELNGYT